MKKNLIPLICAGGVLAVLIIAYALVNVFMPDTPSNPDDIFGKIEYLWEEDVSAIKSVHYSLENSDYTITLGEDITLKGYDSIILSRHELTQAVTKAAIIPVERFVEVDKSEYGKYGFNDSKNIITLAFTDGRIRTLVIGQNTGVDNEVYALDRENGKVCTISAEYAEIYTKSPDEYRSKIICTLSNVFMRELKVSKGNEQVMAITQGDTMDSYVMEYPYTGVPASYEKISEFLAMFNQIDADAVVEENPGDIKKYGFDKGLEVFVYDSAEKHTFKFGDMAPEGGMYIMYGERPVVYRGNIFLYEMFNKFDPVEYLEPYVHYHGIADVESVEFIKNDNTYTMQVSGDGKNVKYLINSKSVTMEEFARVYQSVAGIYYGKTAKDAASSKEYCTVKFNMRDKTVKEYTYFELNDDFCVARSMAGIDCMVLKSVIDSAFDMILSY